MTYFLLLQSCTPDPTAPVATPMDPVALVDVFVGTGGIGAQVAGVSPGAAAPFGHVLVGPDTRHHSYGAPPFYHFGGYHYDDDRIDGFSHTHSHGMGVNDHGAVHVMPRAAYNPDHTSALLRATPFQHDRESGSPGTYSVDLTEDDIVVSIAASTRGAWHHYEFPDATEPVVWFDLAHILGNITIAEADISLAADEVSGHQKILGAYSGRYGGQHVWFAATFDPAPVGFGAWTDPAAPEIGATTATGPSSGGWVQFPLGTRTVDLRLAVSAVDLDGARRNRDTELVGSFDDVLATTEAAWRAYLDGIVIEGGTEEERRIFHTAHYHTALMPRQYADVDGRTRGIDGEIHTVHDFRYLTDLSLWDTFRTLHPFYLLAHPDWQRDAVLSLVTMNDVGGAWPRWPLSHGYTAGMVGTPVDQVLAQSALAGLSGWDAEAAFDAVLAHSAGPVAVDGRDGIDGYLDRGWVAYEDAGSPVSLTLEYAWSDHSLALWAESLGRTEEAARLHQQAAGWAELYDPATGLLTGRHADGTFETITEPFAWLDAFVEGNALHYKWGAPWDPERLVTTLYGGDHDLWAADLAAYWDEVMSEPDDAFPDDWYWHGNEPDLHYAALGALTGHPELTWSATRWIAANRYGLGGSGLDGNDDSGTLSAWYLLSAMGLYPVAGTNVWALGCPFFDRIEVVAAGLVITADGASPERPDCPVRTRNQVPWTHTTADFQDLVEAEWAFLAE